jgi:Zn-dependent M28 family amino/carboxypeptidase
MRSCALLLATTLLCAQAPRVTEPTLRGHLAFLSDDLLEGRGTGQRGGDLTMSYLEHQASIIGLKPANGASYRQPVRIAGLHTLTDQSPMTFVGGKETLTPVFGKDVVFGSGTTRTEIPLDGELIFVGYGITASEEGWDDYKGLDCRGKVLVMMVNDPQPTEAEPNRFAGKALTYYGRWTYKFEEAKRKGALGVLLIHTTPSASYGWSVVENGWSGERFQLAGEGNPLQGWMTEGFAKRLFASAGLDLDEQRAAAEKKSFKPVPLNQKLNGTLRSQVREVEQANIAGIVPGTDPKLKQELVIFSAHWDHLGRDESLEKQGKDGIYNGAVDNASGSASLLAMAQAAVAHPAKRTLMFLWVCAEEQGLLGSAAYAEKPLWPLAKTAAALNLDSTNWIGLTKDIDLPGSQRTTLGATAQGVAKAMHLKVSESEPDMSGSYFRSDHFCFAKAGIPSFSIEHGRDFVHDPEGSKAKLKTYSQRYHQVTDAYDPAWDLAGMVQQAQFTLNLGLAVANAPQMPTWKPGDAFGKARAK